jgi:hypothetical protein
VPLVLPDLLWVLVGVPEVLLEVWDTGSVLLVVGVELDSAR